MQDEKPPMKKLPTSMLPEETAPRPEFPEQEQTPPGLDAEMEPSPDHGESSYDRHRAGWRVRSVNYRRRLRHWPRGGDRLCPRRG